jgi:hypothetical protein
VPDASKTIRIGNYQITAFSDGLFQRTIEAMVGVDKEWDGTKDDFITREAPKPYRTAYREETAHLIADRGDLEWLSPIRIYESEP